LKTTTTYGRPGRELASFARLTGHIRVKAARLFVDDAADMLYDGANPAGR
jgi:hypothetical protein